MRCRVRHRPGKRGGSGDAGKRDRNPAPAAGHPAPANSADPRRTGNRIDKGGTMKRARRLGNIFAAGLLSAAILSPHSAPAQASRADAERDPVLKAMLDELDRSMAHLQ